MGAVSYTPAEQDILLCRNKTTGVTEFKFLLDKKPFILVDVGGQRTERKKWIHSFENVNCLIFFASLSEYDQKLEEDLRVNRMHESLRLFQEVANSKWFTHVPFALMLNKRDLLAQKIKLRDLRIAFPEYSGGSDYQQALDYITTRFLSLNKTSTRKIYAHVSCATDTACVKQIFGLIAEHALKLAMEHAL
ncbi:MAG: guanine nucleotide-binding protein subunit alpha [archaeon]|nr:guanine nucleotide-binding protein subunit alpha [archaeon]